MTAEIREHVFERGFSTKGSSGVGLASVESLLTQTGGIVDIESEVGVGTTVSLLLPAAVAFGRLDDAPLAADVLENHSLLLVEDDAGSRGALSELLTDEGFSVTAVGDVASARAFLAAGDSSLGAVITDMKLPDGTGDDVVRMATDYQAAARVICVSGAGFGSIPESWACTGTVPEFLTKPIDVDVLLSMLKGTVRAPRSEAWRT
jgi:CheY-like chemotaxis protein